MNIYDLSFPYSILILLHTFYTAKVLIFSKFIFTTFMHVPNPFFSKFLLCAYPFGIRETILKKKQKFE